MRIISAEPNPKNCSYLGSVEAEGTAIDLNSARKYARIELKNKAAELGGNLIKLDSRNEVSEFGYRVVMAGKVYRFSER